MLQASLLPASECPLQPLRSGHNRTRIHRSARRRVGRVDERDRPVVVRPGRDASFHCPSRGIPTMASQPVTPGEPIAPFVPDLEALIAEVMDEWKIPGLAIAVVQNGEAALVKAYGLRDVEAGLPVTTDTHFMICSITKSFTSTGLALLVDEQRLDWKNPVRDYIPEFRSTTPLRPTASRCAICSAIIPACRATTGFICLAICHPRKCWRRCVIWSRAPTFAAPSNTRTSVISSPAWWPSASAVRAGPPLPVRG